VEVHRHGSVCWYHQEGNNRITAKLVCQANPASLTTFHSIYVTGMNVPKQHSAITPSNAAAATVVHVSSNNSSSNLLHPRPLINHLLATMNVPKQHSAITPSNRGASVVQEQVSTGNLNSDKEINVRSHCISKIQEDAPYIQSVDNCYNRNSVGDYQSPGGYYQNSIGGISGSSDSNRHHYHNISTYPGSSNSSDSSATVKAATVVGMMKDPVAASLNDPVAASLNDPVATTLNFLTRTD